MPRTDTEIEVLRTLDPASAIGNGPLDARAAADLTYVLRRSTGPAGKAIVPSTGKTASRPLRLSPVLVVAVAAVLTIGVVATVVYDGLPGSRALAYAATPHTLQFEVRPAPASEAPSLEAVRRRVSRLPADDTRDNVHKVRTESWSLGTRVDNDVVRSAVIPQERLLIWRTNLSGALHVVTGAPQFPAALYEDAWRDEGQPGQAGTTVFDETYAAGEFTPMYPEPLSAEPSVLLRQLSVGHPIDEYGTAELFVALHDLYLEQTPDSQIRAAILGLIDTRPDVVNLGEVVDRAGRRGLGVAVDSNMSGLPTRYVLVFDMDDGRLLNSEEVLTQDAGRLAVPIPSVIAYTVFHAET